MSKLGTSEQYLHLMSQANRTLTNDATGQIAFTGGVYAIPGDCTSVLCKSAGNVEVHYKGDPATKYLVRAFAENEEIGMEIDKIIEANTTVTTANIIPLGRA